MLSSSYRDISLKGCIILQNFAVFLVISTKKDVSLSVCLSVSRITQEKVGLIRMKCFQLEVLTQHIVHKLWIICYGFGYETGIEEVFVDLFFKY